MAAIPADHPELWSQCARPFDPDAPDFDARMLRDLALLARVCQVHKHHATCFTGYHHDRCRFHMPRRLHEETHIDASDTIRLARNDHYLNAFNPWTLLAARCNGDVRLVQSGRESNSAMIYTMGYTFKKQFRTYALFRLY